MSFTPEARAKALAARKANIAASAHFKQDWLDANNWALLARKRGVRLPPRMARPTPRRLARWHKALDTEPFEVVYGASPRELIRLNPHTPLWAFVGMMLERATP